MQKSLIHKKCLEQWANKRKQQNDNLSCPMCRYELPIEKWIESKYYKENRDDVTTLMKILNDYKLKNNMSNIINRIKDKKMNELNENNIKQNQLIKNYENIVKDVINKINTLHISLKLKKTKN